MINDSDIISIIDDLGASTPGQIARALVRRYPDKEKGQIYHDVSIKTRSLVKYKILIPIQYEGLIYYALPGTDGPIRPDFGAFPRHKVREYIHALPNGSTFTYADLRGRFGIGRTTAQETVKTLSGIRKIRDKPAVFVKGA